MVEVVPAQPADRYVHAGIVRTRYRSAGGAGPPLLMLHGIARTLEDWRESLGFFGQTHRAFAPDMVGHGLSDKPDLEYGLRDFAQHARDFVHAQGLEGAVVLGSSLGGAVALQLALDFPERVRALVLVGGAGFGPEVSLGLRLSTVPWLGELLSRPSRRGCELVLRELFHNPALVTPEWVAHDLRMAREPGHQAAFLRTARRLGTFWGVKPDWRDALAARLPELRAPVLLVWGRQDAILPVAHLQTARRLLPTARFRVFEGCGHFPQLERPAEFNALVKEFLQTVDR